jgi:hypothetical protein
MRSVSSNTSATKTPYYQSETKAQKQQPLQHFGPVSSYGTTNSSSRSNSARPSRTVDVLGVAEVASSGVELCCSAGDVLNVLAYVVCCPCYVLAACAE